MDNEAEMDYNLQEYGRLLHELEFCGQDPEVFDDAFTAVIQAASILHNERWIDPVTGYVDVIDDPIIVENLRRNYWSSYTQALDILHAARARQLFVQGLEFVPITSEDIHNAYRGCIENEALTYGQVARHFGAAYKDLGDNDIPLEDILFEHRLAPDWKPPQTSAKQLYRVRVNAALANHNDLMKYYQHVTEEGEKGNFVFLINDRRVLVVK